MDNRGIQSLLLVIRHMGATLKLVRVMQYKWDWYTKHSKPDKLKRNYFIHSIIKAVFHMKLKNSTIYIFTTQTVDHNSHFITWNSWNLT